MFNITNAVCRFALLKSLVADVSAIHDYIAWEVLEGKMRNIRKRRRPMVARGKDTAVRRSSSIETMCRRRSKQSRFIAAGSGRNGHLIPPRNLIQSQVLKSSSMPFTSQYLFFYEP